MIAAVRDTGTSTTYCSGIFFAAGSRNSLCTRAANGVSPAPSDDNPATPGSPIVATAIDWDGGPVDPGHRNLLNRAIVLSATYSSTASNAYIDGCWEMGVGGHGIASSAQFMVGSRNDEMSRYLVGDVAEILIYNRVLNASEHAAAVNYLSDK